MMTNTEFDKILNARIESIKKTLGSKAKEYASDGDRLHNFRVAAGILDSSMAHACFAFMTKHIVSIADICNNAPVGVPTEDGVKMIDEKIGDAINYLILLEAILKSGNGATLS